MQNIQREKLPWGVEFAQLVYLLHTLFIASLLALQIVITVTQNIPMRESIIYLSILLFVLAISMALFYGLWKIKVWIVAPILFVSAIGSLGIFNLALYFVNPAKVGASEIYQFCMSFFHLTQFYVFSRSTTRDFFKNKSSDS